MILAYMLLWSFGHVNSVFLIPWHESMADSEYMFKRLSEDQL